MILYAPPKPTTLTRLPRLRAVFEAMLRGLFLSLFAVEAFVAFLFGHGVIFLAVAPG